ncbi:MAG TPA: twin-arginine translocase TatA/TatE family subunit [Solirubrobacteraceae bacterium]|jgi:TatA/E family protein of Tat protein translocase|nr:twin-arginine translocase TatA/TatE family subunit [Solirubrobacteraceae bacterium]
MGIENPIHLLFIAIVALVVLGPRRLPELARSLGRGIREFREAMSDGSATGAPYTPAPSAPAAPHEPAPSAPVAPHEPAPSAPVAPAEAVVVTPPPEPAPPQQVDPGKPVRSGDAPDRRSL